MKKQESLGLEPSGRPLSPLAQAKTVVLDGVPVPEDVAQAVMQSRKKPETVDELAEVDRLLEEMDAANPPRQQTSPESPPPDGSRTAREAPGLPCAYEVYHQARVLVRPGIFNEVLVFDGGFATREEAEKRARGIAADFPGKPIYLFRRLKVFTCEVQQVSRIREQ